jgi:hypothetical protein
MFARTWACGAVVAAALLVGPSAGATSLQTTMFARSQATAAKGQMSDFLAGHTVRNLSVETFETLDAWNGKTGASNPQHTKVGSFSAQGTTGSGRSSINGGSKLQVRNDNTMRWGRYNTDTPAADMIGNNWLDSNDNQKMKWDVEGTGKFNTIAFFLTDIADVGGKFSIKVGDTRFSDLAGGKRLKNGNLHFVLITLEEAVKHISVTLMHDRSNDGFGLGGAVVGNVAPVPLPPAGALLLTGIAAVAGLRRRRAQSGPARVA